MPTTRTRHLITETDDLAAAIDAAANLYPQASRAELVRRLALAGAETMADRAALRRQLVRRLAGGHPGMYPAGYLDALRNEWPD